MTSNEAEGNRALPVEFDALRLPAQAAHGAQIPAVAAADVQQPAAGHEIDGAVGPAERRRQPGDQGSERIDAQVGVAMVQPEPGQLQRIDRLGALEVVRLDVAVRIKLVEGGGIRHGVQEEYATGSAFIIVVTCHVGFDQDVPAAEVIGGGRRADRTGDAVGLRMIHFLRTRSYC